MQHTVEILDGETTITLGVKCDLRMDIVRDYRRPKYTWESGKVAYGSFETNADMVFTRRKSGEISYTIVNATRIDYNGKTLFNQKPNYFYLSFDGSEDKEGVGKVRYWRGEVKIEN